MKINRLAAALALCMPMGYTSSVSAEVLDFNACVEKTLTQNPEIEVGLARIQQAESTFQQAKNSRMPQLNVSVTAARSDNALNAFGMKLQQRQATFGDFGLDQVDFNSPSLLTTQPKALNRPGAQNDIHSKVEMMLPIWNGGKISGYQNQAKAMIQAAQQGDMAVKQYLTFNVYQAYEGVFTARAFIEVATQAVKAAEAYVQTTENLVKQGVVVRSELLSAKVHLSEAQTALEQAKTKEQIALDSLRMLMDLPQDYEFDVQRRQDLTLPEGALAGWLDQASAHNPITNAKQNEFNAALEAVRVAKSDQYPSVNMMASYDWHSDKLALDAGGYTVAVVASWKVFDFGVSKSGEDRARAQANEKQAAARSQVNQTRFAVLSAWRNYQVAQKEILARNLAVQQAEEAQRLIMKRYSNGISTLTELLVSQAQLDKARADLVKATYESNVQKAQVRLATGTLDFAKL